LESAFELFKKEGSPEGLIAVSLAVLDSYAVSFSDFTDVDRWINELEDIIKQAGGFPSPELEIRNLSPFTILYMSCPDHPRFSFWFERARRLRPSRQQPAGDQRDLPASLLFMGRFSRDTPS
jgi:hypothetical protein